jgi:hypothetical protein
MFKPALATAVGALALSGLAGCGSSSSHDPFGPEPDFASIEARAARPTGTLAPGREASLLGEFATRRSGSTSLDVGAAGVSAGGDSGGLQGQALRALDLDGSFTSCSDLRGGRTVGSCACPDGGTFAYDFSGMQQRNLQEYVLKMRFDDCGRGGAWVDGRSFMKLRASTTSRTDVFMILSLDAMVSAHAKTHAVKGDFVYQNGSYSLSMQVDDGYITVSSKSFNGSTGTVTVRDRSTTWTCTVANGRGTCSSTAGESRTLEM